MFNLGEDEEEPSRKLKRKLDPALRTPAELPVVAAASQAVVVASSPSDVAETFRLKMMKLKELKDDGVYDETSYAEAQKFLLSQ